MLCLRDKRVLLGFYQGIGDFLSAVPVINALLRQGNEVAVAASPPNRALAELMAFDNRSITFVNYSVQSGRRPSVLMGLISSIRRFRPDWVFVSPHAAREVSSWKIPALLWLLKTTVCRKTTVAGAESERLSALFDYRVPVNRSLPLAEREWVQHTTFGSINAEVEPDYDIFKRSVIVPETKRSGLVIHPGASRSIKQWPVEYFHELAALLEESIPITFTGLERELAPLRQRLRGFSNVRFFVGPIDRVVRLLAGAELVMTMDSGFSHVAAFLGVRHLAVFGPTDPRLYAPVSGNSSTITGEMLECQPCNAHQCRFEKASCMSSVTPSAVAKRIDEILCRNSRSTLVSRTVKK